MFCLLWGYTLLIITSLSPLSCTSMKIVEQHCSSPLENPINCYPFFFFFFPHSNPVTSLHFEVQQADNISSQKILRNALSKFIAFKYGVNCPWACQKNNAFGGSLLLWQYKSHFASVLLQSCWSLPLLKILFILPGSPAVCHTCWRWKPSLGKTRGSSTALDAGGLKLFLKTCSLLVMSNGVKLFRWGFERQDSPCWLQLH